MEDSNERESKVDKILYVLAIIVFIASFIPAFSKVKIIMTAITIILSGYELLFKGIKNIFKFKFEEDTLMTIAMVSAFILGEYAESCIVILLFKIGEILEDKATEKANSNIENIVKIKSNTANLIENDNEKVVDVENIKIDNIILIKPGEKVPVDCKIIEGNTQLDTSPVTGESKPVRAEKGRELVSGSINLTSTVKCIVIREYKDSTASKIIDLVFEATNNKGNTEKFITKFSKIYTPVVICIAILIAIIPVLFGCDFKIWIMRALIFLVASCPCSIVISIPLAFFSCIGAISKRGMIVKGTRHIENLSKANVIAFDKTGTITTGKMTIDEIENIEGFDKNLLLQYIYSLEKLSNHPISTAIKSMNCDLKQLNVENFKEIAGCGLYGEIEKNKVLFGNKALLEKFNINTNNYKMGAITLSVNSKIVGAITLKEEIRSSAKDAITELKSIGINKFIMLTGDNEKCAKSIAKKLDINEAYSELLPQEKLEKVKELKKDNKVIFVGDGINDGPVLAASDFGIAMGEGCEIAGVTADGILLSNNLESISKIIQISRKTVKTAKVNIIFSLLIKFIILILGILGYAPIWSAVLADTGVTLITVINAIRIK